MFKKIVSFLSVKRIIQVLSGFLYQKLLKEIDKLDRLEPAIVILIEENVEPEEIAISVVDYLQRKLKNIAKKIFKK